MVIYLVLKIRISDAQNGVNETPKPQTCALIKH
jgi:hypothetical protein